MTQEAMLKDSMLDNQLSIWEHSSYLDNELDHAFSHYELKMEETRKAMLDKIKHTTPSKDVVISGNTYQTFNQHVEQSQITINGVTLRQKVINLIKERDGVRLPCLIKELFCSPPCTLPLALDYATITETLGPENERKLLSQFISDANSFQGPLSAQRLVKYENSVRFDPASGLNDYEVKVTFLTVGGDKVYYHYKIRQGAPNGQYTLENESMRQVKAS